MRAEDAAAYRAARVGETGDGRSGTEGTANLPDGTGDAAPAKRNGGYTDALRNDLRVMRTVAVRRALARDPAVATDLIGFVLARTVGFGRHHPGYESPVLAIRKEYQGVYASDAMKASDTMKHLDPVPAVDLAWLAEEHPAQAFRAYRALADEDRASVLAHAVASLTVPRLADDHDVSGAHEEAVRNLDIDFPTELAAIDAQPFDADLVWNRMNKGLILGAAAEALGDDWAAKHNGLKKKDLVAAAAEAFRHDPARDAAVDAAAVRWLPPGFAPVEPNADDTPTRAAEAPTADSAGPAPDNGSNGDAASDSVAATSADETPAEEQPAGDSSDNGALPAFLTS